MATPSAAAPSASPAPDARATALCLLEQAGQPGGPTLDQLWQGPIPWSRFAPRDRALIQILVRGVLRWRGRLDFIIAALSKSPLSRLDPRILNILRLGLFQLHHLDRIPDSAAVDTAVELAKTKVSARSGGFVNALLRNSRRRPPRFPDPRPDPVHWLATTRSFPPWLIRRWLDRWGMAETQALCDAINRLPAITVRVNPLQSSCQEVSAALEPETAELRAGRYAPDALCFARATVPIPELPGFEAGHFAVQDEAAQLVSHLLAPWPGQTVLDACAGRGGKTGHLAALMRNQGAIHAWDQSEEKLCSLKAEMERLGVSIVHPQLGDLNQPPDPEESPRFDRVLVDAPCSGLGVLRRHPDGKWRVRQQDLAGYGKRQLRFLNRLAPLVKPGGILVYAVCSREPEENQAVAKAFLKQNQDFQIHVPGPAFPASARALIDRRGYLKTLVHQHQTDGFFAVAFERQAPMPRS